MFLKFDGVLFVLIGGVLFKVVLLIEDLLSNVRFVVCIVRLFLLIEEFGFKIRLLDSKIMILYFGDVYVRVIW